MEYIVIAAAIVVVALLALVALVTPRRHGKPPAPPERQAAARVHGTAEGPATATLPEAPPAESEAALAEREAGAPADDLTILEEALEAPEAGTAEATPAATAPPIETPAPTAGRLVRLRTRLARSQSTLGRGLLSLLSRDHLDDEAWEEVEDTLLSADVGVKATQEIVDNLRERTLVLGTRSAAELRALLADELVRAIGPDVDRSLHTLPHGDGPAVLLVVGVNGTGKTTTCGKLARVLIADGRTVLLGAADTFRAAAADQLQTWGSRVGADTVRGPEGGDPASVAFDAVRRGREDGVDTVLIDTAGRLHTKAGLMDELGKVKRVVEKQTAVDETLLVLDATTGQNGLIQARVFTEVVDITGVVLTKLDGTAKGGIVIAVQRELGIPVKLVGLGEGPDDLAPFEPEAFVDALLGETV